MRWRNTKNNRIKEKKEDKVEGGKRGESRKGNRKKLRPISTYRKGKYKPRRGFWVFMLLPSGINGDDRRRCCQLLCFYPFCMERSPPFWSCCQEASSPNCWWITAFIDIRTVEEKNSWQTTAYNMSERAQGGTKVTSGSRWLQRVAGTCTDNVSHWEFKLCLIQAGFQVGSEVTGVGQQLHTMKIWKLALKTNSNVPPGSSPPSQSEWLSDWVTDSLTLSHWPFFSHREHWSYQVEHYLYHPLFTSTSFFPLKYFILLFLIYF